MEATPARPARRPLSLSRKLLFAGVMLLLALFGAEIAWRLYLRSNGRGFFDDPNEFRSPFFTTYEEPRPVFGPTTLAYRNGAVDLKKPADEIRIICFGGSTTVNQRAGISYPELVEAKLNAAPGLGPVRVLNAGGEGYSTAHILVNLALRNLEAKPDIITVYENINDLSAIWFGGSVDPDYPAKYKTDFYLGMRHRTGLVAGLCKISRLFRAVVSNIHTLQFPAPEQNDNTDYSRGIEHFRRNLRSIASVARAHGIRVILATQAAKSGFRAYPGFVAYNEAIRQIAESEGIPLIDIANQLTNDEHFLPDEIHNNRAGVEAIAELWFPALKQAAAEVRAERNAAR